MNVVIVVLGKPVKNWKCTYEVCEASCCKIQREVTISDIKRIVELTGKKPGDFISITSGYMPYALKRKDGRCVFLRNNYQCDLHDLEAKPILCKMYPFMLQKIAYGDEPIMFIKPVADCPGYGEGPLFTEEILSDIRKQGQTYVIELRKMAGYRNQGIKPEEIMQKEL